MKTNTIIRKQLSLEPGYLPFLVDPSNKWYQLSNEINWKRLEEVLSKEYSLKGRPAKQIRLMCSLLIIKQIDNLSDETLVEAWKQNPYYQYFSGMEHFTWELPCDPTSITKFRNRIGINGIEEIFKESVSVNGADALESEVIGDTTVQEKNITYPTDTKLHLKIIKRCWKIANLEKVVLRQSYTRTVHKLRGESRFGKGKKQKVVQRKAQRSIKTIAKRLVRELYKKLPCLEKYEQQLELFQKILFQTKTSKNKIYSVHEPNVYCIAKGKAHKKYEYGNKVGFFITKTTNVIVAVKSFDYNIYDGAAIAPLLEFHQQTTGITAKKIYFDRGARGVTQVESTEVVIPDNGRKRRTDYQRRKLKKAFQRRAAIEPIIGHVKQDYRMGINYLKGDLGDAINAIMAASAFNFKRKMKLLIYFLNSVLRYFMPHIAILKSN